MINITNKKVKYTLLIILIPIAMVIFNIYLSTLLNSGRIIGTIFRGIYEGNIIKDTLTCIF